jgi:dihydrofolate reductase
MRKIVLNLAVSLDGFIEGPKGEIDWCFTDQDYGMEAFMKRIDAIFMGRKSFELMKSMGGVNPFSHLTTYVFSNTLTKADPNVRILKGAIEQQATKIKRQKGKDIWLFGGAQVITAFLNAGLVDELQLAVHPILLGGGKPLFQYISKRMALRLIDVKTYSSGLVQLMYRSGRPKTKRS